MNKPLRVALKAVASIFLLVVAIFVLGSVHTFMRFYFVSDQRAKENGIKEVDMFLEKHSDERVGDVLVTVPLEGDKNGDKKISFFAKSRRGEAHLTVVYSPLDYEVIASYLERRE